MKASQIINNKFNEIIKERGDKEVKVEIVNIETSISCEVNEIFETINDKIIIQELC